MLVLLVLFMALLLSHRRGEVARGYKTFSCSTQLSMKFLLLTNLKLPTIANSFLLNKAELLGTIVGILIFISRENFKLS